MLSIFLEAQLRKQLQAQRMLASEAAYYQMCSRNFAAFHGKPPPPDMNIATLREWYNRPWRKTTIPAVKSS